jgi:heme-degrading monooxygenase HmoA
MDAAVPRPPPHPPLHPKEGGTMSIFRLIHIKVDPGQTAEAERLWNKDCGPLMIRQKGCVSERLLKCIDGPGEYISYSEWEDQKAIDRYRDSDDHKTIQSHARKLQDARAEVKRYEAVG